MIYSNYIVGREHGPYDASFKKVVGTYFMTSSWWIFNKCLLWARKWLVFLLLFIDPLREAVPLWACEHPAGTAALSPCWGHSRGCTECLLAPPHALLPPPRSVGHAFFSGVSHWVQLYQWEFGGWQETEIGGFFTIAHFQLGWVGCPLPESHSSCLRALVWSYSSGSVASTSHASRFPIPLGASHCC